MKHVLTHLALRAGLLAGLLTAGPAPATVGGEWLCDVLGYDAAEDRVYVHQLDGSGADSFGIVAWMPLAGEDAGTLHPVDWNRAGEGTAQDPWLLQRLTELRARLAPLPRLNWPTLPYALATVAADSVPNQMGRVLRLRVRAQFGLGPELEVTCWDSGTVIRPAVYALPNGAGDLWVIAFIGDSFEMGYETQVPVLVRPGERGLRQVEWRRAKE